MQNLVVETKAFLWLGLNLAAHELTRPRNVDIRLHLDVHAQVYLYKLTVVTAIGNRELNFLLFPFGYCY